MPVAQVRGVSHTHEVASGVLRAHAALPCFYVLSIAEGLSRVAATALLWMLSQRSMDKLN